MRKRNVCINISWALAWRYRNNHFQLRSHPAAYRRETRARDIPTFFNLFSREIRTAFRRTRYHIREADAETQELVVVVRCQWFGRETA